ncbi:MAG TPA: hypothetical protein VE954_29000, partial [Oligoflexus sp.]|uniref:hypothetical protein n=1 Tax=Oligoflexus sp. TaxID=1971216 RepID=UPI002D5D9A23
AIQVPASESRILAEFTGNSSEDHAHQVQNCGQRSRVQDAGRTGTVHALEKTLVNCKIQGKRLEEFPICDSIAPQLRAGTVLHTSDL